MRRMGLMMLLAALLTAGLRADAAASVRDIAGARHLVPDTRAKATVLIFAAHDCPVSNQYAPEIRRICQTYKARGVAFYLVYAEPKLTTMAAKSHWKSFGYTIPAVIDTGFALTKKMGATATPEAVILSPKGDVLYRGRIDDLYFDFGQRRAQPTSPDLRLALDAVLSGRPVARRFTKVIGCFIPTQ